MKKILSLLFAIFTLSGCEEEEDKILKELKEMNHRQEHYYATQLTLRRLDDQVNSVFSNKEKQDMLNYREGETNRNKNRTHMEIIQNLKQLKTLNKKNFTGTFAIHVRTYVLSKSSSWISEIPKLLLLIFTSNKHDEDIYAFKRLADTICFLEILRLQQDWFPDYVSLELEKSVNECKYHIGSSMKYIDEDIQKQINSHSKSIENIERYLKRLGKFGE